MQISAHMLALMHTVLLHTQVYISENLHQIREIEVYIKSDMHANHDSCVSVCTCKNAHMVFGYPR